MTYLCIPLRGARGGAALVSEASHGLVADTYWYQTRAGYAYSPKKGLMHRRIMAAEKGEVVDHQNFDRLDNRLQNLRATTQAMNNKRVQKRATSWPFKGVRQVGRRWMARITVNRTGRYIGSFDTAEAAARAYDAAARQYFRHLAVCNFGDQP